MIGRWLAPDPLADLQPNMTPYHYVSNNPLNRIDPFGLSEEDPDNYEGDIPPIVVWGDSWVPPFDGRVPGTGSAPGLAEEQNERGNGNSGPMQAFNLATTLAGVYTGVSEFSLVANGKWYSPALGRWVSLGYYGSMKLTLQSTITLQAKGFQLASKGFFYVNAIVSGVSGVSYAINGQWALVGKSGLDIGMAALATYGGPPGLIIGGTYFIIDNTIGWTPLINSYESVMQQNREILGPNYIHNKFQ